MSTRCLPVERLDLAGGKLVADEEVLRDPLHLFLVHEVVAAPPLLELEEALALGVDLRVQVVELGPVGVRRVQVLEVVDEVGAVELAVAEIARERGHPGAAEQAARVAHRVLAGDTGPVGDRRAGEQDRPDELRRQRGEHHQRPAALAVADDERLLGLGVQLVDLEQELRSRRSRRTRSSGPAPAADRTSRSSTGGRPSARSRSRCRS